MFFELELLRRGGKFHLIWKSATLGINKLKRKEILSVDVVYSCNYILSFVITDSRRRKDRFSLMLSSKLINGVARILEKQAEFVLKDICTFLAIVRRPIIFDEIEDVADQFDVPKPARRTRTKKKIQVLEEIPVPLIQVEAEPEIQPITDIQLITLIEPTERPQKSTNEEFLDLGTGEEPELLLGYPTLKPNITTEVEERAQQKRVSRDTGIVSFSKVPKTLSAMNIEEALKETTEQILDAVPQESQIIPPNISNLPTEPERVVTIPEAARESFIRPIAKKRLPRNQLLITIKARKSIPIQKGIDDLYTDSTSQLKTSTVQENLSNCVSKSTADFLSLYTKFSSQTIFTEDKQRSGDFSRVSQMSSLKVASTNTTLIESIGPQSIQNATEVSIPPLEQQQQQTIFADVHSSMIGRTSTTQEVSQSESMMDRISTIHDVNQCLLEESDLDIRERLRLIIKKIINFEEKNTRHATLEDIANRPFTRIIIARLFNDLLSLVKLRYVKLINKENSLELDHIELGPKTIKK